MSHRRVVVRDVDVANLTWDEIHHYEAVVRALHDQRYVTSYRDGAATVYEWDEPDEAMRQIEGVDAN